MSLDKSFYMDEELGLDLKQEITKVDMASIDLCLLSLEEKVMETEVDQTKNYTTTIQDAAAKMEEDREVMSRDLQETVLTYQRTKCVKTFKKNQNKNKHTYGGINAGRVEKMKTSKPKKV